MLRAARGLSWAGTTAEAGVPDVPASRSPPTAARATHLSPFPENLPEQKLSGRVAPTRNQGAEKSSDSLKVAQPRRGSRALAPSELLLAGRGP